MSFPYDQFPEVIIIRNDNTRSFHNKTLCIDTQPGQFSALFASCSISAHRD
jgi:hypothetical protein